MNGVTIIAGIPIPSTSWLFLAVVGIHVLLGLTCTITGIVAMLSVKGPGWHPNFGTIYYWCLLGVFVTATGLSVVRWPDDYDLFILAALSFGMGYLGREARRKRWSKWPEFHVSGMGASYIILLTAFYVDNGKNLPLWRELPQIAFWILPSAIGIPIVLYVLSRHSVVRRFSRSKGTIP
jgi:hypothetical protein